MSESRPKVVFDAVVFVQALISGRGPAAACIERVAAGEVKHPFLSILSPREFLAIISRNQT